MGSSLDTNTSPDGIWYTTRESIMRAFDVKDTARNRRQIDDAIEAASRGVEGLCHRTFFPVLATRYFDWPDRAGATPWVLRLDDNDLISATSVSSGGKTIPLDDINLEPNRSGPPFTRVEIRLSTSAAYGGGPTYQRDITISGLWGYRNTEQTLGALTTAADSTTTSITVDATTSADTGIGSILRIDTERLLVTDRRQQATGQTGTIDASKASTLLPVADSSQFAVDEVILLDAERMRIDDIAGNNLVVERAYDGTVLTAHTSTPIYAPRALTVTRGALGTTAGAHTSGSTVAQWTPPGLVSQLARAEAIWALLQERSGWFRNAAASGRSAPELTRTALDALADRVFTEHGRKARMRSV
ncbi:hypothetical protein [Streptomyces sp. NPDC059597]|uniref:hypothetical protein n=1 Tax=Streptomyces sp. NPDC059597 TaxID=3346879 RepID=UPI00369DBFBC